MARVTDNLAIVTDDEPRDAGEEDAEAEQALLLAFASTREAEKTQVAAVEIPRYQGTPRRDANGKLVRGADGKIVLGPLSLYFRRLEPGTMAELRDRYTHEEPIRRRGRIEFQDRMDDEGFSLAVAYTAMVPWCRQRYFDDQRLWGSEPVGTGQEFLQRRLNPGELSYCLEAVMRLEGLGDERADQLGKH